MEFWEVIICCVGLSLDVMAMCVCEGALLRQVHRGRLSLMCLIFCLWQVGALELGRLISRLSRLGVAAVGFWRILAVVILFGLAVLYIFRALRRRAVYEHRSEISFKRVLLGAVITSIDALFVGASTGFLETRWLFSFVTLFIVTGVCGALGVFIGYHFGYEQKTKAYWCGGALFIAAGFVVLFRHLL